MYHLVYTNRFKKDIKRLQRRGVNMDAFKNAIVNLEENGALPVVHSSDNEHTGNTLTLILQSPDNKYTSLA